MFSPKSIYACRRRLLLLMLGLTCGGVAGAHPGHAHIHINENGEVLITTQSKPPAGYTEYRSYQFEVPQRAANLAPQPRTRYDELINQVAQHVGVEAALLKAVVQVESSFDPKALSPKGAQGLMQLMPQTAQNYGVEQPWDARQNLLGGARHLRDLLDRYDDFDLALAAYNAGSEAVIRYDGVPPYPETQTYVRRVQALQKAYRALGGSS